MKNGINGIFQFQIYGIPLTGDDICGFNGDSWIPFVQDGCQWEHFSLLQEIIIQLVEHLKSLLLLDLNLILYKVQNWL